MTPDEELVPFFKQAKEINPNVAIICSITGTDKDPQNRAKVKQALEKAGAVVMNTNVEASELAETVIRA